MKVLTAKQRDALLKVGDDHRPVHVIAKELGLGLSTVQRWKSKMKHKDTPAAKRKYTKTPVESTGDKTREVLAKLVKIQLDSNPDFLKKVIKLLDWDALLRSEP